MLNSTNLKKADSLIMPIFYSIDQSIELYIKAIIRRIEEQLGEDISIYKEHDIKKLQSQMKGKIKKVENKSARLEKHLKFVSDYIDELYLKIKSSNEKGKDIVKIDFARYPFYVDGAPHFYVEEKENVVVDIENLRKRFNDIRLSLESLYHMYEISES